MSINMIRSKSRGQQRKFKRLLSWMDKMEPFKNANELSFADAEDKFEHFHVPCGPWLSKPKTSGKIKTAFCKKWIEETEEFINKKPKDLPFCKVVAAITYPDVRQSQIIIFYDEEYYNSFWDRKGPYQVWTPTENERSFAKERGIVTELPEIGYIEKLNDEDWYEKSYIWFYGEWLGSEDANVESNLKTMAMRIRDLLKESNHAQWKEVDDFLKQYEHMHVCDEKLIRRMVCNCHIRAWGDLYIAGIEYGDWINLLEDFSEALKKQQNNRSKFC